MKNYDIARHVKGESLFVEDLTLPSDALFAYVLYSSEAHAEILKVDIEEALSSKGVKHVITSDDIPGENQIGGIIQDEELLASRYAHFIGEPVAMVLASSKAEAKRAAQKIKVEYKKLPAVTGAREAFKLGSLIMPPRVFSCGNVDEAWKDCDVIVEGSAESGAQEHLYLETQGAVALPVEGGGVKVISSTQAPTSGQKCAAKVLGLPMNMVEVDVNRLGGAFGGKEDQANAWCALAALGAFISKKTVKLTLARQDDMRMTGKRHPYSSDYKLGLTADGKIKAYEVTFYQNAGATADLSPAILDRTLFHCNNVYNIPNIKATGISCRTNLPPNTAFRGFGGPQGMFVIEAALYKAAEKMNVEREYLQRINLLKDGDVFHYGQPVENSQIISSWEKLDGLFGLEEMRKDVKAFNNNSVFIKKGFAVMPVCFGISFTNTFMNQASALVHIYSDGSVSVSTAAIEMGQGVNSKIREVAASVLGICIDRVKIETTNTSRVANTSPTAASSAADMNGKAAEAACGLLRRRLLEFAKSMLNVNGNESVVIKDEEVFVNNVSSGVKWTELIKNAFFNRVNLSAQAQYAVPNIFFDKDTLKGKPFAYHSYGAAAVTVSLDCLRGVYEIESVKVVHDFGKSFTPLIDRGQAEGAIMQGIGWMTMEEIIYNENGKLVTDALSTYKVPDINFAPGNIEVVFLENDNNPLGIFNSKAIGEPPLMYGIGAYFALLNAIKDFRPGADFEISAPMTCEKALMYLYSSKYLIK
jgi:xanthine dehydrogenase large subunit